MPQIMEIALTLPEGQRLHPSMGSVLHGALMEYAHEDFAAAMHRAGVRPFSQFVYYDKQAERAVWRIAALNGEAAAELGCALAAMPQNLCLKQKGYVVQLSKPQPVKEADYAAKLITPPWRSSFLWSSLRARRKLLL